MDLAPNPDKGLNTFVGTREWVTSNGVAKHEGDLWICVHDGDRMHRYTNGAWVELSTR